MDNEREPVGAAVVSWSPLRHWATSVLAGLVALVLIVLVPSPVFRVIHSNAARQLVDDVATGRAELLAKQDEFRSPLVGLGAPVRSWTQPSCWLTPRYSDGDGEQGVVMFYWQECSLVAYEVYALSPEAVPAPDRTDAAHVVGGIEKPMTAKTYVVYEVRSPVSAVDVGCERQLPRFFTCAAEPRGFPVL